MANKPNLPRAIGNEVSTTISGSITDSALSLTLNDSTGFDTSGGYAILDEGVSGKEEVVYIESISGSVATIATDGRGLAGTTGVSHDDGASITDIIVADHINGPRTSFLAEHNDDGTHGAVTATSLTTDTINESTGGAGVTVTGVFQASGLKSDTISEQTADAGVTIDGVRMKDNYLYTDRIFETSNNNGVIVDSTVLKDGEPILDNNKAYKSKKADNSIIELVSMDPDDHLVLGQVNRQGGNATDFNSSGTTNYLAANVAFEVGRIDCAAQTTTEVSLTTKFSGIPLVFVTPFTTAAVIATLANSPAVTASNFHIYNSNSSARAIQWRVLGPVA